MKQINPALHRELTALLAGAGIEDAALEAQWILEDIPDAEKARGIAARRAKHEPLQYLLGKWEFYGLELFVGEGVLIPRADTETLVDAVLERVKDRAGQQIADLCTGSGCIALALAAHRRQTRCIGIDISEKALCYAEKNLAHHQLPNAELLRADVLAPETAAQFRGLAAVVSNPPYLTAEDMASLQPEVRFEPESALFGGKDGLDFYQRITVLWKNTLMPGGLLAFETGAEQADAVCAVLAENGFAETGTVRDLNGIRRVVLGVRR